MLSRPISELALPPWLPILPALVVVFSLMGLTPAISPDSVAYLAAAEELRSTGTIGPGFLMWPPLYPVLLSLHGPVDPLTFAAVLGDFGALATLVGAWLAFRDVLPRATLALTLLALVTISRYGTIFGSVWSEAVYLPLTVWLAYFWSRHLAGKGGLVPACLLLALAMLTRHVGVVLACAMGLTALAYSRERLKALAGIALACVPWGLWVVRTYRLSGTIAGPRPELETGLLHQFELFGRVWAHWAFPHSYFVTGGIVVGSLVLLGLLAALWAVRRDRLLAFCVLWALGHSVLTVYTASRTFLDVDARTLFPIFWPVLLVFAWVACKGKAKWVVAAYALVWFSAPNAIINALI